MGTVGIRELKQDTSRIIRRVREGRESFEVTYHGKVVAKLVPVDDPESKLRSFDEFLAEWDALTADDPDMPVGNYAVEAVRESRRRIE